MASRRREQELIPTGATWIHDSVSSFDPAQNIIVLASGERVSYRYQITLAILERRRATQPPTVRPRRPTSG